MTEGKPKRACESCHFWDKMLAASDTGLCRRSPPNPSSNRWPETHKNDWCGELKLATSFAPQG